MIEKGIRLKLRFETDKGNVNIEQLYDLPLTSVRTTSLDMIAKRISLAIKENGEQSFVEKKSNVNEILELKLEIVKHVIAVKLKELDEKRDLLAKKEKKEKILEILEKKSVESLENLDEDSLKKMLAEL